MKKGSTTAAKQSSNFSQQKLTIGLDLGDRSSGYCVLDERGEVRWEDKLSTTAKAMREVFGRMPHSRIALETGVHSPWVSRLLSELGHEVIVAPARNVRLIGESRRKDDRLDAQTLARLARIDPQLLCPVKHRSAKAQADLTLVRARAGLVRARTALVNTARGLAKSYGERLRGCNVRNMNPEKAEGLSLRLIATLGGLLLMMGHHSRSESLFYYFRLEDQVPENHLLRLIDRHVSFSFVRTKLKESYSDTGRPSIDPELLLRILLVGYLYGVTSERKLVEELRMHLAWRWFAGLGLDQEIPHHSTFSKNRHGRFQESHLFRELFEEIVRRCVEARLVKGEHMFVDGSFIQANADHHSRVPREQLAEVAKVNRTVREY